MSYSLDFRRHVLKIKAEKKLTAKATGAQFGVSSRTIQRWEVRIEEKVKRETGARKLDMEALKEEYSFENFMRQYGSEEDKAELGLLGGEELMQQIEAKEEDKIPEFYLTSEDVEFAENYWKEKGLNNYKIICFQPSCGTGSFAREWKEENYASLGRKILDFNPIFASLYFKLTASTPRPYLHERIKLIDEASLKYFVGQETSPILKLL